MPDEKEVAALREELEFLAASVRALQHEYHQLRADFAAALRAVGGAVRVDGAILTAAAEARIARDHDPTTGAITFRFIEDAPSP